MPNDEDTAEPTAKREAKAGALYRCSRCGTAYIVSEKSDASCRTCGESLNVQVGALRYRHQTGTLEVTSDDVAEPEGND